MRTLLAVIVSVAALGATSVPAAPVEAGKVYSGSEGEEVAVVPLTPRDSKKFLVRVQGTGTPIDGKVWPAQLNDWSSSSSINLSYVTQHQGREYWVLTVRDTRYTLNVIGRQQGISVSYDEKRTQALKVDEVWAQHQKQQADGTLAKLMAFDRPGEQARHDAAYAELLKELNGACKASVTASIDWSTVSDEQLKELSISGYCEAPLSALKALCDVSNVAKQTVQAKVKQVSCRFGPSMEARVEAERIIWTTSKDAANQEAFATRFFKKNL